MGDGEARTPGELPCGIGEYCRYDRRVQCFRAPACAYSAIIAALHRGHFPYDDQARAYTSPGLELFSSHPPRDYQAEAIARWEESARRGIVVLPTGTGKSFLAQMAIARTNRSTLVIVPTLDLLAQWVLQLRNAFRQPIGILGGGTQDIQDVTVSTYDSALLTIDRIGNRFGLLVVDECHHLPGPSYSQNRHRINRAIPTGTDRNTRTGRRSRQGIRKASGAYLLPQGDRRTVQGDRPGAIRDRANLHEP